MADRTPEDREAARLERERRRATREGATSPPPAGTEPAEPAAGAEPGAGAESPPGAEAGAGTEPAESAAGAGSAARDVSEPEVTAEPTAGQVTEPEKAAVPAAPPPQSVSAPPRRPLPQPQPPPQSRPDDAHLQNQNGANFDGADGDGDLGFETDEHEVPSGTRRVSHFEKVATKPKGKQRRPKPVRRVPRGPKKKHSWWVRGASLLALVLAGALIWFLVELFQPLHGSPHGRVTFVVPQHASSSQIGDELAKAGVVSSGFFFDLRATLAGKRGDLRAGLYHLQKGMSYSAALDALTKAPAAAKVTNVTIIEGRSRHEVNDLLKAQHVRGSYLAATRGSPPLNLKQYGLKHPPKTLEGFLFPDTYQLVEPIKMSALVSDQLKAFKQNFSKIDFSYARSRHLTPYDVLIIGSLIEGEAATKHDRPLVASVIYNRLADGMALQLDATTRFATGNYTKPLTISQLHSQSPYNTRTHTGLPPGPINSPGMAALQAAAHPAHTHYLFFFTKPCTHNDVFASTYAQFLAQGSQNQHCAH
jgi:UPF0755 protein